MTNPGASVDGDMPVVCFTGAACFWPHLAYLVLVSELENLLPPDRLWEEGQLSWTGSGSCSLPLTGASA